MPSSGSSSICRIDWRPSRWLAVALVGLGVMSALSLWLSDLPWALALPGSLLAAAEGVRLSRRHLALAPCSVDWLGGNAPAYLTRRDGLVRLDGATVQLRGPLATLAGKDAQGRTHRLAWWPDTLAAGDRRQLRLIHSVSGRSAKPPRKQAA